jgi:tetratricopeptide (TPR) repeat protein
MKLRSLAPFILGLASAVAMAQQQPAPAPSPSPGGGGGGTGTGTPTPGTPGRPTEPFPRQPQPGQQDRMQFPETMQRPIFLSGKVVLDDGTPPPDNVVIERVCNGIARPEGYTDSKGRFSFQLGQNQHMMPDASVSSAADSGFGNSGGFSRGGAGGNMGGSRGITERDLVGCELRANLAGYRSEIVNLSGRRVMDNPDVGTIVMRRLGNVEGLTISATTALAPKDAKKAFEKGREAAKKQKWADAQKELEKATQIYPKYAVAWYDLGQVHEQQKNVEEARKCYAQALEADAKYTNPYLKIAGIQARESKWQEVADTTDRVIKLNPFDFPIAYFYNAIANLNLQKIEAAEKSALEGKKIDTRRSIPKIDHVLGVIMANKRDYSGAAQYMKSYLASVPDASDAEQVRKQLAEVEKTLAAKSGQQ